VVDDRRRLGTGGALTTLAPDAVLERRDELLDADALCDTVSQLLDAEVETCERVRATYHPGRSLRVLLRVRHGGSTTRVSARMRPARTLFSIFPADRKLPALRRLMDGSWPSPGAPLELVVYAPEKSATAAGAGAYVKLYADTTWARTAAVHVALRASGLRVPAVVAAWPELRALAVEAVAGRPLAGDEDGYRAFGAALASLHRLAPLDGRPFDRLDLDHLARASATIGALRPDVAATARRLERTLRRRAHVRRGASVCLHGDVHPKNVLVDGEGATLVDLDDVAAGPAAADLGSALAGLTYDRVVGRRDDDSAKRLAGALLDGYGGFARADELRWYTAAALLGERALRSITRLRPAGLARLYAVLAAGLDEVA
jgi:aminoglycoside phosphotransferase (APT) family kinase protein